MDEPRVWFVGVLILVGAFFTLVAAVGILRLGDVYMRMHAASKAGTLGSGVLLVAIAVYAAEFDVIMRAAIGVVFFLLTAPVSAHLLARAAYESGDRPSLPPERDAFAADGHNPPSGEDGPAPSASGAAAVTSSPVRSG